MTFPSLNCTSEVYFTKITESSEQFWQQSLAQPLTMMEHHINEWCPVPCRETINDYDEGVAPLLLV